MVNVMEAYSEIISSKKYSSVCKDTVLRICKEEEDRHKNQKTMTKAVKNKIHQIHGAFVSQQDHSAAEKFLSCEPIADACTKILSLHSSTKERLSFYKEMYADIFSVTQPGSIIDIACGFNPFFLFSLEKKIRYYATDINDKTVELLNKFFCLCETDGQARCSDILVEVPAEHADLALLFKLLPLIEQQRKGYAPWLLNQLCTKYIALSFPTASLSGKRLGMKDYYSRYFDDLMKGVDAEIIFQKEYYNELVYIIKK